ncbi:hypothetical protein [Nitratireductor pacificus]|uniref:Uncharacterized protein n=1 Tax=Nitratireductor pacificus pht-3B TaxID=391937 RepID=K2M9Y6_9HYPH|nr:hypothetical protein [Nitratireductor pacificus]EKF18961.1 hypothetical protein NA2_10813 [Nitratireductor pacificus pht-3B]
MQDDYDPAGGRRNLSSGTRGFVYGALAAAAFILLTMAILKTGFFTPSDTAEPIALQSGPSVPQSE